ncbi:hypothetical protein ABZX40_17990 [Streptomyces sp. NPDC004610]|uniref:hypothetical protein n=1 Tax=unclassified Streptomyces TaxID=2593676 RepID=UPI0033B23562
MARTVVYEADWWPHINLSGQRAELCAWLAENGIDPDDVPVGASIVIEPLTPGGGRAIRHTVHLRNAAGCKYHDEALGDPAQEERVVPLVADPPPHWPTLKESP